MSINFDYYKIFYTVVNAGKISAAAEKLYTSQPAVTQIIHKLENLMGVKLLYRSKAGINLTYEGKLLYDYVKDSVEKMENAENFISRFKELEEGNINISGGRCALDYFISPAIKDFSKKFPKVNISLKTVRHNERVNELTKGNADIIITDSLENSNDYPNIEITKLVESDEFFVIVSNEYAKKNNIKDISDIRGKDTNLVIPSNGKLKEIYNKYFEENNIKINTVYSVDTNARLFSFVKNEMGLGCTSRIYYDLIPENYENSTIIGRFKAETAAFYMMSFRDELCNKAVKEFKKTVCNKNNK